MIRRVGRGLLMNHVQKVPYYRVLSENCGFDLLFFDPQGINWGREIITGLHLNRGRWRQGRFSLPKVVYNRCYPGQRDVVDKLGGLIGPQKIFNTQTQLDKWDIYQCLCKSEVATHLPLTYQYGEEDLPKIIDESKEFILKPRLGYGGLGVLKVAKVDSNIVQLSSYLEFPIPLIGEAFYVPLLLMLAPPLEYIGQQYIDSFQGGGYKFDIRIVMQKNFSGEWEVGGQLSRVARAEILLTNNYVAVVDPRFILSPSLMSTVYSLSHLVAKELEGKFGNMAEISVDFFLDQERKPWILEVNGKPDKSLFGQLKDEKMLERVYLNPLHYQRFLVT